MVKHGKDISFNPKTQTYVSEPLTKGQFQGLINGVGEPPFDNFMNGKPYYLHIGLDGQLEYGRNKNVVPPELLQRR